jgi:hypothetical protein
MHQWTASTPIDHLASAGWQSLGNQRRRFSADILANASYLKFLFSGGFLGVLGCGVAGERQPSPMQI